MLTEQRFWSQKTGWQTKKETQFTHPPQLVLVFGGRDKISQPDTYHELKEIYPDSNILLASTAGEILDNHVTDDTLVVTAIQFQKTELQFSQAKIKNSTESHAIGEKLATTLPTKDLTHTLIFADGINVNGTKLVEGLTSKLPTNVTTTGGLVGDGSKFEKTYIGLNEPASTNNLVLIGLYGDALQVGYGSFGGWDPFGIERIVTKSQDNVLFELDHEPALNLYKTYLGDEAKNLPSSGLLFPLKLELQTPTGTEEIVRTILAVDEKNQSITFAGDIPEGATVQLMKANFERLIDGAKTAATMSLQNNDSELALLISCVGRKLILNDQVGRELDTVKKAIGEQATITGFYSYGEISPASATSKQCLLHNQTMTITTFTEL